MTENREEKKDMVMSDYAKVYVRNVHRIGRTTTVIAFVLMFLPVLYLQFVAGYSAPLSGYMACTAAAIAAGIGGWIAEPISYFPILGAGATYMSYVAGNVGNTRVPVAVAVQNATNTDSSTPKGQLATVIGVGVSVFFSLIVLTIIITGGSYTLKYVPEPVITALGYILPCLYGSMLTMRLMANFKNSIKYVPVALLIFIVCKYTGFTTYGLLTDIVLTSVFAYIMYKTSEKKA